ncbi:MAG: hypothetical protein LIO46_06695 [Clostridiales bacterium]|nr:hypothetical protein [Clostridiales bacterium]
MLKSNGLLPGIKMICQNYDKSDRNVLFLSFHIRYHGKKKLANLLRSKRTNMKMPQARAAEETGITTEQYAELNGKSVRPSFIMQYACFMSLVQRRRKSQTLYWNAMPCWTRKKNRTAETSIRTHLACGSDKIRKTRGGTGSGNIKNIAVAQPPSWSPGSPWQKKAGN